VLHSSEMPSRFPDPFFFLENVLNIVLVKFLTFLFKNKTKKKRDMTMVN